MDDSNCNDPKFNKYYQIVNTKTNQKYLFIGSYHEDLDKIFKKLNEKKTIDSSEKKLIEKYY